MVQEPELSVLLIEDEPDAARLIQHVLTRSGSAPVSVTWAQDLQSGLANLASHDFHAVLLDLNLPDSSGFETFAAVRRKAAKQAVIVLTGQEDEALALQAVRSGADEYLIKSDIRDRFLVQRIRYAVERNRLKRQQADPRVKNGRILSFIGAKGGVGTTTLVVNLAAALAQDGKTTLAIELAQAYGCLPLLLNRAPLWDLSTVLHTAPETISRETVTSCLEDFGEGFRALCAPIHAENGTVSPEHARAVLGVARALADFTLVDLPMTSAPLVAEVMQRSSFTLLVVERTRLGLHAAMGKIKDLQSMAAHPADVGAVLVNKTPFLEFLTPTEFSRRLGCGVVAVVPPATDLYAAGETDPLPILGHPDTSFAESLHDLARRLNSPQVRLLPV